MDRTRPKCRGWAEPGPTTWVGLSPARVNSVLHCSHATWTMKGRQGQSRRNKREDRLTCGGCCSWRSCWSRQARALVVRDGRQCCSFFFLSPLFFLYFICFFFFLSFFSFFSLLSLLLLSSLLFSLSLFSSLPSSLSNMSFFLLLPYFCLQKQGRDMAGAATVLPPLQHVESFFLASRVGRRLFEKESASFWRERWR